MRLLKWKMMQKQPRPYRERERLAESPAFGEWKTVTAVAGADYTYTAQAIDFAADRDYEYQLLINDAETGEIHNFSAATGIQLPNAGFETWTNSKTWYPCSADEIGSNGMGTGYTGFWGTGNPGANAAGIVVTEPADDPRPGSTGSKSALLKTQSAFGVIAAGNLFIGAELLLSERFDRLIAELRKRYDYIIVDNVPAGMVADASIVNRVADLTIFVVRSGFGFLLNLRRKISKNLPEN